MSRALIPTAFFALVVVRDGNRFLVVREAKHDQTWYLPAGRAEAGETLAQAAHRETFEESGVPITLEGVLTLQHTPGLHAARVRAVFLARPAGDPTPRTTPNEHSLEARWVTLEELRQLPLRGPEVLAIFEWVSDGAAVYPLDLIGREDGR